MQKQYDRTGKNKIKNYGPFKNYLIEINNTQVDGSYKRSWCCDVNIIIRVK